MTNLAMNKLVKEGLPPTLKLAVTKSYATTLHVRSSKGGTWCGMFKWTTTGLRGARDTEMELPLCRMCLRTNAAEVARQKVR